MVIMVPKQSSSVQICANFNPLKWQFTDRSTPPTEGGRDTSPTDWSNSIQQARTPDFGMQRHPVCLLHLLPQKAEHFQKRMSAILSGFDRVVCQMDHVLVFEKDQPEHDSRLTKVFKRIEAAGVCSIQTNPSWNSCSMSLMTKASQLIPTKHQPSDRCSPWQMCENFNGSWEW